MPGCACGQSSYDRTNLQYGRLGGLRGHHLDIDLSGNAQVVLLLSFVCDEPVYPAQAASSQYLWILRKNGQPATQTKTDSPPPTPLSHPVVVAIEVKGGRHRSGDQPPVVSSDGAAPRNWSFSREAAHDQKVGQRLPSVGSPPETVRTLFERRAPSGVYPGWTKRICVAATRAADFIRLRCFFDS